MKFSASFLAVLFSGVRATPTQLAPDSVETHNFLGKAKVDADLSKTQILPVPVNPKNLMDWESATQHCFVHGVALSSDCASQAIKDCMSYVNAPPCASFILDTTTLPSGGTCSDVCADLAKQNACVMSFGPTSDSVTCNALFGKASGAETCKY